MLESKRFDVVTAGTPQRAHPSHLIAYAGTIQASSANTGTMYIGGSGVAPKDVSNRYVGHQLLAGDSYPFWSLDLYDIYIDGDTAGDQAQINYQRRPAVSA